MNDEHHERCSYIRNARVAQVVERDLAKVEAAGSSPVSRSLKKGGNVDKYSVSGFLCVYKFEAS